ncbi:MAG TPA: response regulator [Candidatus Omnitrophota bacterium]|nr:response regulator [Candidatus Omnitrophota bacterium]
MQKKLMVVDDEPGFSQLITDYFKSLHYEVLAANDMEEALAIFKREKPKVILLDFQMPIVTGEKLLPLLQSIEPTVRVIVVSGFLEEEVEEKFKGLGYFAYFKKGDLSLDEIRSKVEEALSY